jgi:hypothetical protein
VHQLMQDHGVQIFFYGHDHTFTDMVVDGIHYTMPGSAGAVWMFTAADIWIRSRTDLAAGGAGAREREPRSRRRSVPRFGRRASLRLPSRIDRPGRARASTTKQQDGGEDGKGAAHRRYLRGAN